MTSEEDDIAECIDEFVVESQEHLEDVENKILRIEAGGEDVDVELVNEVFRAVHSVKGAAGFLGFTTLGALAHALESVLDRLRQCTLNPSEPVVQALLGGTDRLTSLLSDIHSSNDENVDAEVETLLAQLESDVAEQTNPSEEELLHEARALEDQGLTAWQLDLRVPECCLATARDPQSFFVNMRRHGQIIGGDDDIRRVLAQPEPPVGETISILYATQLPPVEISDRFGLPFECFRPRLGDNKDFEFFKQLASEVSGPASTPTPEPKSSESDKTASKGSGGNQRTGNSAPESSVRVSVALLDSLMNYSGELVLARNQLLQALASGNTTASERIAGRINLVTSELQEAVMHTRLQPIGSVFAKFPRVVRELATKLKKRCTLTTDGGDVELDRKIIQAIGDPLTHLVRNAADHGIESPTERQTAGKPVSGTILLSAHHQGGTVKVSITDDGAGIDPSRLRDKAVEKGILRRAEADQLSDRDACRLIFHPGFSTAAAVTDVSGRGVGMDVVKSNIQDLGGTIEIDSELGKGTTINVVIPLTLAILSSMIVTCADNRYVIPQSSVVEIVRIWSTQQPPQIQHLHGHEVLRLRGDLLPIARLSDVLGCSPSSGDRDSFVVVLESGLLRFGLVVDAVVDAEEIVVKPLGHHLKGCSAYAGATILGDGKIGLILDLLGIASMTNLAAADQAINNEAAQGDNHARLGELSDIVLVRDGAGNQFSFYLGQVARIARIGADQIHYFGGQRSMEWEGAMIPLLSLPGGSSGAATVQSDAADSDPDGRIGFGLIHRHPQGDVAILADTLLDIRREAIDISQDSQPVPGVCGVFLAESIPTRLIDIHGVVVDQSPGYWTQSTRHETESSDSPLCVLLAEDSTFFRTMLAKILRQDGLEVIEACDGEEAWETLSAEPDRFDILVTDIEMPRCSGLELTRRVRADASVAELPVIALTSLATEDARSQGIASGVDDYQVKLEQENLQQAIRDLVRKRP